VLVEALPARQGVQETNNLPVKISERVARLQTKHNIDEKEALKRLARELGQSKSELYRELQRERAHSKTGAH